MFYIFRIKPDLQVRIAAEDIETEGYADLLAHDYREDYPGELILVKQFDTADEAYDHALKLAGAYEVAAKATQGTLF